MNSLSSSSRYKELYGPQLKALQLKTIEFVYRLLPIWRDNPYRVKEDIEDKLDGLESEFLEIVGEDFVVKHFDEKKKKSNVNRTHMLYFLACLTTSWILAFILILLT